MVSCSHLLCNIVWDENSNSKNKCEESQTNMNEYIVSIKIWYEIFWWWKIDDTQNGYTDRGYNTISYEM